MSLSWMLFCVLCHHLLVLPTSFYSITNAQSFDYPIANLSTLWTNNLPSLSHNVNFTDRSRVRSLLLRSNPAGFGPSFACGFYCNGTCDSFLFAIFIVQTNSGGGITRPSSGFPQVIWSANRDNPVKENATLQLSGDGDLILKDVDGTLVWSTNTTGNSVVGLNMTETGNLVLFDGNNKAVWQSFEHPTDCLVPGQTLVEGQRLTASISSSNWTTGVLSLFVTSNGLFALAESDPPQQIYYRKKITGTKLDAGPSYVRFLNGSLSLYILSAEPRQPDDTIPVKPATSMQYIKFGSDGHLRVYEWNSTSGWTEVGDLLTKDLSDGECSYPTVCGNYGICSTGQCSCPIGTGNNDSYFRQLSDRQLNLGCSESTPLSCEASENHSFQELKDVTYFIFFVGDANTTEMSLENCRQACLNNCSCKAALFLYHTNASAGSCFLPTKLFSLIDNDKNKYKYNTSAFIKVQIPDVSPTPSLLEKKTSQTVIILGSSLAALFSVFIVVCILIILYRKKNDEEEYEEDDLHQVPGMPRRFSYQDLKDATENFCKKLGEGGFGSVFEGTLGNGTKVAVKCLDGLGQVKKSFLAEVETIGSIHHVNLVRLIGFCSEKSHRLLVYEFMSNGSLDKWIFCRNQEQSLDWKTRRKIIFDIAKGLAYLHEDCRQRILHLDIKPQNILLDDNFNAKVSDFGLSKLIDRDQSEVVTTMRGTPGYLAPEWLSSMITEKVDVYSFGVVVMEIVCGRKNLDRSQSEDSMHLISLIQRKAEEGQLFEMIDRYNEDMQLHGEEAMEMMRIAAWCLQSDFTKRPSMSVVVKVLEGVMNIEPDLDYNFSIPTLAAATVAHKEVDFGGSTPLLPSVLSGPR
ncbi:PREDICTED: G-type lectin S-receptor-like serine/threonine-protein kinase SD2-5 [Nelumbo nucifera]|uniref:Receptor-like serine/threonine-protein kinase n=2 Tax=Nelumbo nucifera TaxID=4432 RepID=A0A822YZ41_NELNU|nr:PREDICTED: G-type lectin S-receptor-like serine/threonine-protein kinase SD2-5 [Nelumbo nucifera]DAD37780.1 TPA_asm: hypothetical protein HUJ06_008421 [Nelumbo nucifera]